jgi:hypothetical protein
LKNILLIFILFIIGNRLFGQCDSVQVTILFTSGDCDESKSKRVKHFTQSGKLLFSETYYSSYPDYAWRKHTRDFFIYDSNDSLINHTSQNSDGSNWIDVQRYLFSYNSSGSLTSSTEQKYISNVWQTLHIDSNTYDTQNNLISHAYYSPGSNTKNIFINNISDSTLIVQHGDSTGAWINFSKREKFFNGALLIQDLNSQWVSSSWNPTSKSINYYTGSRLDSSSNYIWTNSNWESSSRELYLYSAGLPDSIITQTMNTVWENHTLTVNIYSGFNLRQMYQLHWQDTIWIFDELTSHDYDVNGRVIRDYYQTWQDTIWINISSSIYEYGPLNKIIHSYTLAGNDTGWIYETERITEIDQYGHPTYQDELYADDYYGSLSWQSMYGPSYTNYDSTGLLISCHGSNIPGGPYYSHNNYSNGFLIEGHGHSETMGGLATNVDTYGFLADIKGDSAFCTGSFTTLYTDSCPSNQYYWSNGAHTASIQVSSEGSYHVTITHPNGHSYVSPEIRVKIVDHLPFLPMGIDSTVSVCGNRSLQIDLPSQNGVFYQWYRNDSAMNNNITSSVTFFGSTLQEGEYYLCALNACGTDTSASTNVHVLPYPNKPLITPNGNLAVCVGDTLQLNASTGISYKWYPGEQTTQSISVYNSGNYIVTVFDTNGCGTRSDYVNVTKSNLTISPVIGLQNGTLQSFNGGTLQWFLNGDTIQNANHSSLTPVQTGEYTIAISDNLGCVIWSNSIYINPDTLNVYIPHTKFICENGSVQIGGIGSSAPVLGGIPPYSYSWSTNNLIFFPGGSSYIVSNLTNDQTYYLRVRDSIGNMAVDSVDVIVDHPLKPIFSPLSNCDVGYNPLRIKNYSSPFTIQRWYINGIPFQYPAEFYFSGIYQVLIKNEHNCPVLSDPDTLFLKPPPPIPVINATLDPYACTNGYGILWVNSTPGYSYEWTGSSNLILGIDTFLNINSPVTYELQITDSNGCFNSGYFEFNLEEENIGLTISYDYNNNMCDLDTVQFNASVIPGWTYAWYDTDDNFLDSGITTLAVNTPGAYKCIATSPTGCTASETAYYSQQPQTTVSIIDSSGILYASALSYTSFQWFRNGVEIPGAMNFFYVPVTSGEYYVRAHDTGHGWYCPGYSNRIYIGICSVNVINGLTCSGMCSGEISANGTGTGMLNYLWSNGSMLPAISNLCEGIYVITITDSIGCVARDTATVVSDDAGFSLVSIGTGCNGCSDGQIMIIGNYSSVIWQPNAGILSGNLISNLSAGNYNVCLTDSNQCIVCISDTILDPPMNINDVSLNKLSYFPNPVSEKITVNGLNDESFKILIYDYAGRLVDEYQTILKTFDVSKYVSGIYTMEFRSSENIYRLVFIKE